MKSVYAFLAGMMVSGSIGGFEPTLIKDKAYHLIYEVLEQFTPETAEGPGISLTNAEKRAVGRYFDTPELKEVYPGIGRVLKEKELADS